jgi:general secretion pathway protein D
MNKKKVLLTAVLSFSVLSCSQQKPKTLPQIIQEGDFIPKKEFKKEDSNTEQKVEKKVEPVPLLEYKVEKPKKDLPPKTPLDLSKVKTVDSPVFVSVESMPLVDFVQYVFGEVLKVSYFIDDQVKNNKKPITLRMADPMEPSKLLSVVVDLLEKNGVEVQQRESMLYLTVPSPTQKPADIIIGDNIPNSYESIINILPLKYIKPSDVEFFIKTLYPSVNMTSYTKENAVILRGSGSEIREVVNTIKIFDVPILANKKVFMVKLVYWTPDDFVNQIKSVLESLGITVSRSIKEAGVSFIPIKFANSLIVIAPDEESINYVLSWVEKLDNPESVGTEEKSFVYKPKYAKASELVEAVRKLYSITVNRPSTPTTPTTPTPQTTTTPTPQTLSTPNLRIASDDLSNTILVQAKASEYKNLLVFLENLDLPPKQVLLETTIAEITLKDDLQYGLEWFIKNRMNSGDYTLSTLGQLGLPTGVGLTYRFITDTGKFQSVINMLAKDNKINIVSTPRILVLNNREATIQIGTEVPIVTGEIATPSANTQTPNVSRSIQYRTTGTILKVKPTINTEGLLTLDISQEVSDAQQNTTSGIDSPLILTRRINTSVSVQTGQTIVLGGIISENKSRSETKVPVLGDIPLFGNLFKSTSIGKTKTELVVMITPVILNQPETVEKLSKEIINQFRWYKRD